MLPSSVYRGAYFGRVTLTPSAFLLAEWRQALHGYDGGKRKELPSI